MNALATNRPPGTLSERGAPWARSVWPSVPWIETAQRCTARTVTMPFDGARRLYAIAAQTGLIEKSMLANRDFERALTSMEALMLGPWARRI